ncbi:9044_t:CDS:2 [Funneliformis geosporum]|uniref:16938_t:CDS:1 n=1 Tax=Funneliformis geosporum TaxID=1117311 RepID=A0A9W4WTT5_9GLOM|nr:16938_t:CDS:2 [Funneliformis geosporum]CAI2183973.1 9044_t:CDS:2 [Funneliformis geosporum]
MRVLAVRPKPASCDDGLGFVNGQLQYHLVLSPVSCDDAYGPHTVKNEVNKDFVMKLLEMRYGDRSC